MVALAAACFVDRKSLILGFVPCSPSAELEALSSGTLLVVRIDLAGRKVGQVVDSCQAGKASKT